MRVNTLGVRPIENSVLVTGHQQVTSNAGSSGGRRC